METFTSVSFKDTRKNTCLTLQVSLGHEPVQCVRNQISTYRLKKNSICNWKKRDTLHTVAFKSFTHKNSDKKKKTLQKKSERWYLVQRTVFGFKETETVFQRLRSSEFHQYFGFSAWTNTYSLLCCYYF